ncbi:lipopolysaccharide biosynthesis protein [Roseinatronobacter sp. NSM]|uniref:lipopolysaccharide biosynthesis protein n=1 Tax=Roseinatronobacter sp. NSM TaxID=3457785 RepID=UPI0040367B5E
MRRFEASGVFIIKVTAAAVSYIFVLLLARMMAPADFGIVGALLTGSLLLSVTGILGQRTAILRFIPPLRKLQGDDAEQTRSMINRAFTLGLTGMIGLTVLLGVALLIADSTGLRAVPWPVFAGLALIPLVGWIDMQAHLARAWRSVMLALVPKEILWRALVLVAAAAVYFWGGGEDLALGTVVALMIGVLVVLIMGQGAVMGRTMPRPRLDRSTLRDTPQDWRRTVVPFWVNGVASMFLTNADVVIVALVLGGEPAAYYFAANRVAMLCHFFLLSQNIVVGPKISAAWHSGERDKVRAMVQHATIHAFVPTTAVAAIIFYFSADILNLFGEGYGDSYRLVQILAASAVIQSAFGPAFAALELCNRERSVQSVQIIAIVSFIFVALILVSTHGTIGMAISVMLITFSSRLIAFLLLRKTLENEQNRSRE